MACSSGRVESGAWGASEHEASWGTDPRGFLRTNSLKAGSESYRELSPTPFPWSPLGTKSQGMVCPHIPVEAPWVCPRSSA